MNYGGGGATYNQAPSSVLAENNGIKRHPEPKAKDPIKKQGDSSVASLLQNDAQGASGFLGLCLQNDVQGTGKFFGLCAQNDKTERENSSGFRPQNDIKKDVILSQRRRIHLKPNWIFHSVQNDRRKSKHAAFTMAEVLITLGLIGVVAALTIPNLTKRYEEKAIITKYKKVYSVLANAYNLAMMESGPPDSWILEDEADLLKILEPHLNVVEKCYYKKGCTSQGSFVSLSGEHRWGELNDMEIYPKIRLNGGFSLMILDPVHQGCEYDQENIDDDGNPYTTTIYECGIIYAVVTNNSNPKNKNYFGKDHFVFAATNKGIFPVGYNRTDEYVKKFCKKKNQNATTGNGGTCGEWIIRYDNMDYFYGSKD